MLSSLENRLIIKGEDKLACGFLDEDVLTPAYVDKLKRNLSIHQREKEYLYGCLFFFGKIEGKIYRAPLILYPAKSSKLLNEHVSSAVEIDTSLYRINYSLLDVLNNKQLIEQGGMEAMHSLSNKSAIDEFATQLSQACEMRGITCRTNKSVAFIPIDILLEKNGKYLGVDLVGYPGFMQDSVGINRHQILERAGMKLVPVGYVKWQVQKVNILDTLEELLN